jgi:hypothetical protein
VAARSRSHAFDVSVEASTAKHGDPGRTQLQVFLVEIEYMRTAEVFSRLPTKSLPYIFHVPPHFSLEGDGVLKVLPRDVMQVRMYTHLRACRRCDHLANLQTPQAAALLRRRPTTRHTPGRHTT